MSRAVARLRDLVRSPAEVWVQPCSAMTTGALGGRSSGGIGEHTKVAGICAKPGQFSQPCRPAGGGYTKASRLLSGRCKKTFEFASGAMGLSRMPMTSRAVRAPSRHSLPAAWLERCHSLRLPRIYHPQLEPMAARDRGHSLFARHACHRLGGSRPGIQRGFSARSVTRRCSSNRRGFRKGASAPQR
jgi:hypothetical protein